MNFFGFEMKSLMEKFPFQAADLEADFKPFELEAINDLGLLKNASHVYLGN